MAAVAIRDKPNSRGSEVGDAGIVAPPYFHSAFRKLTGFFFYVEF